MRVVRGAAAGFIAMAMCSVPARSASVQPVGGWRVDYGTSQCVALREYGTTAKPLTLVLKPSPKGGVMRILVVRKGSTEVAQVPAWLDLGDKRISTNLLKYSDEKNGYHVVAINVPMADLRTSLKSPSLDIRSGPLTVSLGLSALGPMIGELDKCLVDLQDFWNLGER
jgi:hypothetical protein